MIMEAGSFQRQGQAWFCTTGLPSDVKIEVGEMLFHLHKFPLISRSGMIARLVAAASHDEEEGCLIELHDIPGGAEAFELAARFCYGIKMELTAANIAALHCAAVYLQMTEDYGEANLISKADNFLNHVVLHNWRDSVRTLSSCEALLPQAEDLHIVKKCVDSLAMKVCTDPSLSGWQMIENGSLQSPAGSKNRRGIGTSCTLLNSRFDWWYEDIAILSLHLYRLVILATRAKGLQSKSIGRALMHYARKSVPGLNRRQSGEQGNYRVIASSSSTALNESDQRALLEAIEDLIPAQKGAVSTQFLLASLKTAMILNATHDCRSSLERRIGAQLEQASVDELLIPNYSYTSETLYDIDCIQRMLDHFLVFDQTHEAETPRSFDGALIELPAFSPIMAVAKLMDGYLAEVAPDANLKLEKFQSLADALPEYARVSDDGLYRAIDIYLKEHPWITEQERETISSIMECQKLSLEACTHASQNDRLPLRTVVQVLFFEQLQLRSAVSGSFFATGSTDLLHHSRPNLTERASTSSLVEIDQWAGPVLKSDMDSMKLKVNQLESEFSRMRLQVQKVTKSKKSKGLSGSWNALSKKLGCKNTFEVCELHAKSVVGN